MNELPPRFLGAWDRRELTVDGASIATGRAVWIEAGAAFIDVRGPGGPASDTCFAGTTSWCDPYLTWVHELDAAGGWHGTADIGRISVVDGDLLEEGALPGDPPRTYSERWRRLPGSDGPVAVAVTDRGIAVRVGDHAATVVDAREVNGPIAARYDRWDGGGWRTELWFGDPRAADGLPPPLDPAWPPPPGWSWRPLPGG
jgi:hypothetical protein